MAAVQSSSAALSGGGGEHGVSTATGGGAGGAPEATPEECFEIHDNDECFAAGCNLFLFHPRVFTVVDDVCEATDDLGHCFLQDENSGGNFTPEAYVRDFGEGAPYVIGLSGEAPLYGWTECSAEIAVDIRECCCVQSGDLSEVCADITPFPAR